MRNRLIFLTTAIAALFTHLSAHADTGLIGQPLSAVQQKSDLFVFFNFAPIGKTHSDGATVTSFKPTGEAFRALVTLEVSTDAQDKIEALRLFVNRSFIDDPKKTIYAADLVKSFLGNAGVAASHDDIAQLASEISARATAGSEVIMLAADPPPQAPAQISPAYQTYSGKGPAQTVSNASGSVQVTLRNDARDGKPVLELVMSVVAPK
jgi:hypothetical protein